MTSLPRDTFVGRQRDPRNIHRRTAWTHTTPPRCLCSHGIKQHRHGTGMCWGTLCGCASYRPNTNGGNQ